MLPIAFITFSVASSAIMVGVFLLWLCQPTCCYPEEEEEEESKDIDPSIPIIIINSTPKTKPIQIESPFYKQYQTFPFPNF